MTKAELIVAVAALAKELDKEVETDGLTNAELEALLDDLQAEKAELDQGGDQSADTAQADGYKIAQGKAITSKRGILSAGDAVKPEDFASQDAFDALVKSKHIVK